jgi:peptidyl-prolyl cis-trans isomerase C
MSARRPAIAALLAVGLGLGVCPAVAQVQATGPSDPIVARVNGNPIHASEVNDARGRLPPQFQGMPDAVLFEMLLGSLIDTRLAAAAARAENLDKDPGHLERVRSVEQQLLERLYVSRKVEDKITPAAVKAAYAEMIKDGTRFDEVRAAHILVETEAQAGEVLASLKKGGDFEQLAKARSTDSSAARGGDLGFFGRDEMVPEFADVAFRLKAGEVSPEPVRTQFGWHVIKAIERRQGKPPAFEEIEGDIRAQLARDISGEVIGALRAEAKVERFGPDGKPVPAIQRAPR